MNSDITILFSIPKKANDPTSHTSMWAEKMVNMAKRMGYNVVVLRGNETTYENLSRASSRVRPRLFVHSGHGCPSHLNGNNECILTTGFCNGMCGTGISGSGISSFGSYLPWEQENNIPCFPLCNKESNLELFNDCIIFTTSCHSARPLGEMAIMRGTSVYWGYDELLLFPVDSMRSQDIFMELHLESYKMILNGYTIIESIEATERLEDLYIKLYKPIKYISLPIIWNKIHRKVIGDLDTTIRG